MVEGVDDGNAAGKDRAGSGLWWPWKREKGGPRWPWVRAKGGRGGRGRGQRGKSAAEGVAGAPWPLPRLGPILALAIPFPLALARGHHNPPQARSSPAPPPLSTPRLRPSPVLVLATASRRRHPPPCPPPFTLARGHRCPPPAQSLPAPPPLSTPAYAPAPPSPLRRGPSLTPSAAPFPLRSCPQPPWPIAGLILAHTATVVNPPCALTLSLLSSPPVVVDPLLRASPLRPRLRPPPTWSSPSLLLLSTPRPRPGPLRPHPRPLLPTTGPVLAYTAAVVDPLRCGLPPWPSPAATTAPPSTSPAAYRRSGPCPCRRRRRPPSPSPVVPRTGGE